MNGLPRPQLNKRFPSGFSLVELVVALAVAGLLLGFAAPSFESMMRENRRDTALYGLMGDLQFARSEAIKRSARVSVCARSSVDADACSTATLAPWEGGWLVFVDDGATPGVYESADETLLRVSEPVHSSFQIKTIARTATSALSDARSNFVRFGPRGTSNWRGGGYLMLCDEDTDNDSRASAINLTLSGDLRRARRDGSGALISAFGTEPTCAG
jgi:type IV fimbrial biogenesis protein FimT